jgi:hypothetical protein
LEGTRARLSLLSEISSRLASGSRFQARLVEAIALNGQTIIPAGTLFEGSLTAVPARRLMRPGSLALVFEHIKLPQGKVQGIKLNLLAADSPAVKTDREGHLHPATSKRRLLLQFGGAALAAKLTDDLAELAAGGAVGAGSARYIGAAAAAAFLAFQKGRDVKLKPGDKIEVEFVRDAPAFPQFGPGAPPQQN